MPRYVIREARDKDSQMIYKLWLSLSYDHYKKQGKKVDYINAVNDYHKYIADENHIIYIAESEENIVGFIEALIEDSTDIEGGKYIYILHCFIEKDFRNTKIVFDFLEKIEDMGLKLGINTIFTDIYIENTRFYNNIIKLDFYPYKTRFIKKI